MKKTVCYNEHGIIECALCKHPIPDNSTYYINANGIPFGSNTCFDKYHAQTQSLKMNAEYLADIAKQEDSEVRVHFVEKSDTIADTATKRLWDNEAKHDKGKLQLSLVPPSLERAVAEIRMYGQAKYGDAENWRSVERERYFDALLRHVNDMRENGIYSLDSESKLKHLHHVATNVAFLIELSKGE